MIHPTALDGRATPAQNRLMHALWRHHGITKRNDRLRITSVMIGRDIDSSRDLTRAEVHRLIDQLSTEGPEDIF